ncbi:Uncharacterized protein dnm_016940 [Desulfonema magnum]|uniref:Uncharacterized protein n=1 Tax=Desulfonema magnum TaxID=45655 RepID=A0A975GLK6_9BACT|nr:Uncharacterized protein dnm_016940 [Desulfonema magnum]
MTDVIPDNQGFQAGDQIILRIFHKSSRKIQWQTEKSIRNLLILITNKKSPSSYNSLKGCTQFA